MGPRRRRRRERPVAGLAILPAGAAEGGGDGSLLTAGLPAPGAGARRSWSNVHPVAFRASLQDPWVIDWSALAEVERLWRVRLGPCWREQLADDADRYLAVMRIAHGVRERGGEAAFWRWVLHTLLGPRHHWSLRAVDQAWVREHEDDGVLRYEVSVGLGLEADLVAHTPDREEAWRIANEAIRLHRAALASALIEAGGLAAELGLHSDRWPEPWIGFLPRVVDKGEQFEALRRLYEELRERRADGDPADGGGQELSG